MKRKQKFYNEKAKNRKIKQAGFFGFLYHKLVRFYIDRKTVARELLPEKLESILDVGSDNGLLLFELAPRVSKNGYGTDLSDVLVKGANKEARDRNLDQKIKFRVADIDEGLPFADKSFAVVTCLAVLEHVFDPLFVFKELTRVVEPGGFLIVEVPNLAWFPRRLTLFVGQRPRTSWAPGWDGGHLQYFTLTDLRHLFKARGFIIEKETCSGVFASFRNWWLSFLAADLIIKGRKLK